MCCLKFLAAFLKSVQRKRDHSWMAFCLCECRRIMQWQMSCFMRKGVLGHWDQNRVTAHQRLRSVKRHVAWPCNIYVIKARRMRILSPLSLLVQEADIPQCILLFIWRKSVKDCRSCAFLKLDYGVAEAQILRLTWCHETAYNSWLEWNFWVRFVAACFVDIRDSEKHKK